MAHKSGTAIHPGHFGAWPARCVQALAQLSTTRLNLRAGLMADTLTGLGLLAAGVAHGAISVDGVALTVAAGLLLFSFIEYAVHRWLFHGHTGPFARGHARHHARPLGHDALPFFLPPLFWCALAWLLARALAPAYALLLAGVMAAGYAAYGISHVLVHVAHFKSTWLQRWVALHEVHHRHPKTNFGVTTGLLWDVVLHTGRSAQPGHSVH